MIAQQLPRPYYAVAMSLYQIKVIFDRHVTMQWSDWPELFGMARAKESAQRYQTILSVVSLVAEMVE